uniref:Uncharacterized protein n=1 Tax=Tanacetum cinerariifolium TaxID=118510 RepID=A0A699H9G5_TANCI|nr:hypothetical protein [Tanacetum cinerariifolium]
MVARVVEVRLMVLLLAWDRVSKIKDAFENKQYKPEDIQELFRKLFNDVQNIHEELAEYNNTPCWNRPAIYNNYEDDDEEYTIAITPFEDFSDSNDDSTSIDDDSFSIDDIDYVEASPHSELISLKEVKDFHPKDGELEDDVLREKLSKINILIAKIKALNANPTLSSDFVLKSSIPVKDGDSFLEKFEATPKLETFKFDIEEKNSGSTTIHADISLSNLDCFYFKRELEPRDLTSIIDPEIRENVSSMTNVNLPFEDDQSPLLAYVVWIFLSFLTYPVAPPYLLSFENKDTIFDPASPFIILLCGCISSEWNFHEFQCLSKPLK